MGRTRILTIAGLLLFGAALLLGPGRWPDQDADGRADDAVAVAEPAEGSGGGADAPAASDPVSDGTFGSVLADSEATRGAEEAEPAPVAEDEAADRPRDTSSDAADAGGSANRDGARKNSGSPGADSGDTSSRLADTEAASDSANPNIGTSDPVENGSPSEAQAVASAPENEDPAPDPDDPTPPRIETLRIEPDGMALIAGLTAPDEMVEITLGDTVVASGRSAADGSFLVFGDVPQMTEAAPMAVRSTADGGAGRRGTQVFIVEPPRALDDPASETDRAVAFAQTVPNAAGSGGTQDRPGGDRGVDPTRQNSSALDASEGSPTGTEPTAPAGGARPLDVNTDARRADTDRSLSDIGSVGSASGMEESATVAAASGEGRVSAPQGGTKDAGTDTGGTPSIASGRAASQSPNPGTQIAALAPDLPDGPDGAQTAGRALPSTSASAPDGSSAPAPLAAPRVLRVDEGGLQVVQGGPSAALSIDTISYASDGATVLGGRAPGDSAVRVYIDNTPVEATRSGPDGQWRLDLPRMEERVYTLRVDQVGADGSVVARAETPFKPEDAATLDALAATERDGVRRVTVQPGFTLWAIAERNYGDGFAYVRVFEANAADIRNPDLIYPGQIFDVPE